MRHVYSVLFIEHTESILGIISGPIRFSNKGNGDKLLWKFHLQEYSELSVHAGPLWLSGLGGRPFCRVGFVLCIRGSARGRAWRIGFCLHLTQSSAFVCSRCSLSSCLDGSESKSEWEKKRGESACPWTCTCYGALILSACKLLI